LASRISRSAGKSRALHHVRGGEVERPLRDADGLRRDGDAGVVEGPHRQLHAVARRAQQAVGVEPDPSRSTSQSGCP